MSAGSLFSRTLGFKLITSMMYARSSYESAIQKLNSLQSNKASLDQIRKEIKTAQKCTNIEDMENYLHRTGVSMAQLDEMSVVHVAGTKGKGSTSAMCESILRHHGFRTGFFSSPHLVAVRERVRLAGRVIPKDKFAKYLHEVYDKLDASQSYEGDMPRYFAFLTVLAYNIFLSERVDVAVVEVGIGGVVDYTNVLRKVPIVGITALGLDHTSILGNTIELIAEAKAGIMKPGCAAYTVAQPHEAMRVLQRVAADVKCPLYVAPAYSTYTFPKGKEATLPVELDVYKMNASLAIQLAHAWMRHEKQKRKNGKKRLANGIIKDHKTGYEDDVCEIVTDIPSRTVQGLTECRWPGRYQVLKSDCGTFYLDGAHTKESMEVCAKWFQDKASSQKKILLFSATGDRDVDTLLKPLAEIDFHHAFFVIPTAYKDITQKNDNYTILEQRDLIGKCQNNANIWESIQKDHLTKTTVLECVSEAFTHIRQQPELSDSSVLITGSLYLVGSSLSILDPKLSD